MRPFEFDLPSEKLAHELNKSFSVLDTFSGMARMQAKVQRSLKPYQQMIDRNREMTRFAGLSSITGIAQAIQQVNKSVAYDGLIGLNKAMTQMRSVLPSGFQNTLAAMARQQEALFGKSLQIAPFLDSRSASQLASMRMAINGISGYVADLAAGSQRWEIAEAYEAVTAEAINLADHLFDEQGENAASDALWQSLWASTLILVNKSQKAGKRALRVVEMVVLIWGLYQIYVNLTNPAATKADLRAMEKRMTGAIHDQFKAYHEGSSVQRNCMVRLKPRGKSTVFCKLRAGYEIVILQVSHQWVFISFTDPADGYPATGWVLKKYLNRISSQ